MALSVSDGSDVSLENPSSGFSRRMDFRDYSDVWWDIAKANHMDRGSIARLWQMFASVGKKESVWESMHGKLEVTKDKINLAMPVHFPSPF